MMKRILLLLTLCVCVTGAQAEVYKWIDADGKTQYGDAPPKNVKAKVVSGGVTVVPATVVPPPPAPSRPEGEGAAAGGSANVAPKRNGNTTQTDAPVDPAASAKEEARAKAIERCKNSRGVDCENEVDAQSSGQPSAAYVPIPGWSQPPIRPRHAPAPRLPTSKPKPQSPSMKEMPASALSASAPLSEGESRSDARIKPMR